MAERWIININVTELPINNRYLKEMAHGYYLGEIENTKITIMVFYVGLRYLLKAIIWSFLKPR